MLRLLQLFWLFRWSLRDGHRNVRSDIRKNGPELLDELPVEDRTGEHGYG